jgi:hypothetical protein
MAWHKLRQLPTLRELISNVDGQLRCGQ